MRNSRHVILAAAFALASTAAMADRGGGGHGGMGAGGMGSIRSGATMTMPGTGSPASIASSTRGAAQSGLPVGQGSTTAQAAHARNLDRAQDRLEDRNAAGTGVELENEANDRQEMQRLDPQEDRGEVRGMNGKR